MSKSQPVQTTLPPNASSKPMVVFSSKSSSSHLNLVAHPNCDFEWRFEWQSWILPQTESGQEERFPDAQSPSQTNHRHELMKVSNRPSHIEFV